MKVFCISGKAQHGKDTTARYLAEELRNKGKRVLITHYADLLKYICKQFFEWNGKKDEDGRHILQYVGTDIIRQQQPDYWVDFIVSLLRLFHDEWDYVLIPDSRFPNEIENMKHAGFETVHIRVVRPDFDSGLSEEAKRHISETALDSYPYDALLVNPGDYNYKNNIVQLLKQWEDV